MAGDWDRVRHIVIACYLLVLAGGVCTIFLARCPSRPIRGFAKLYGAAIVGLGAYAVLRGSLRGWSRVKRGVPPPEDACWLWICGTALLALGATTLLIRQRDHRRLSADCGGRSRENRTPTAPP